MKEDKTNLWAHCVSAHAAIIPLDISLSELKDYHKNEHNGPCTIRNHKESDRSFSFKKMGEVPSEADD